MKNKKEYIILIVLILALGAYLYFKRTDQVHYRVPQPGEVDTKKISRIEIAQKGLIISVSKKDNAWYIDPKGYPADTVKVEKMLKDIGGLTLTDLVSESKNYIRYDLSSEEKITVKAFAGTSMSRSFDVGKVAPSSRHTFVMLPGDAKVYQAKDNFREDFQLGINELRNRQVLAFPADEIKKIGIVKGGKPLTLTRREKAEEAGKPNAAAPAKQTLWADDSGREAAKADVDTLLSSLSRLECGGYLEDLAREGLGAPETTVTLAGAKEYTLSLHAKQGDKTPATSSGSPYVFTLPNYGQEEILKNIETLMNKK